jgi:hypothetical protein
MSNEPSTLFWVCGDLVICNSNGANPLSLGMTDPTAQEDMVPPPKPPRPAQPPTTTDWRQVEADERYARQLAEHYNSSRRGPRPGWESDPRYQRPRGSEEDEERDYSFFDGRAQCAPLSRSRRADRW